MKNKILDHLKDIELDIFIVFLIIMGAYYIHRMYGFAPWYDELYTYNFFISRGPVYAGIHWPVPNNHLGYSALSGILYVVTHEPFISLRGVSLLCSLCNLIMLFFIGRKLMIRRGFALLLPAVYAGAWQVNNITVQGRGYALSCTMMLIALLCLVHLALDPSDKRRYYVLWALSMILGFYTVMTTLYWVVTVCVLALAVLLSLKKTRILVKLIIASVAAAIGTLFVYSMVWLAIGSNLLSKDEAGAYFGLSHFNIIAHAPLRSLTTGARYMLDTPYIQSVERTGYLKAFGEHFLDIFNHFYSFGAVLIVICILAVLLAALTVAARTSYLKKTKAGSADKTPASTRPSNDPEGDGLIFFTWAVICFTIITPAVVFVQVKLPYIRTFTYYAVALALCVTYLLYTLFGGLKSYFTYGVSVIVAGCVFALIFGSDYNNPYGEKEESVLALMKQADLAAYAKSGERICLTDCNQEYMYRFVYDEYPDIHSMDDADIIILDKEMLDPDADYHWEFYYDYSTVDPDILANMDQLLRNTDYEVYINKGMEVIR